MGVFDSLDDLDVASVRLFLTVAELGSVSKAAARHGVTQPSATARIQKLERAVGVQLLERSPTGSFVTADGQQQNVGRLDAGDQFAFERAQS